MGTRSRIAIANADGTFRSVYCHWDGYPSHVGVILRDHYKDAPLVECLLDGGDMSSLETDIKKIKLYSQRGESDTGALASPDFEALCQLTQNTGGEYLYVFKGGNWFCAEGGIAFFGDPADKPPEFLEHIDEVLRKEAQRDN